MEYVPARRRFDKADGVVLKISEKDSTNQINDLVVIGLVIGILLILFIPIPPVILDLLVILNFSIALLVLLLTFHVNKPVDFSTFPSILLIATLFRLSLNVAATRLILSEASAGKVISAIGSYVVGGNYVIGLIVFLILVVVQYVVVTSGAQRVSEVSARFTLDSMPGQQMSIDADLNMGFIDQVEAQRRRKNLEREAAFYGAMDGASKFVKGDAIAGILIMIINIVGGIIIGVMQMGFSWGDALRTYTLLTIGDGIVTQVPALVISVGTGIIVTRSAAADGGLSGEITRQAFSFPRALFLVALAIMGLAFLPGMPGYQSGILMIVFSVMAWVAMRRKVQQNTADNNAVKDSGNSFNASINDKDDPYGLLGVEPIEVHVGSYWVEQANQPSGLLIEKVSSFRKQHAVDIGMVLPKVIFKEATKLSVYGYEIHIDGVVAGRGEARADRLLAIHPGGDQKSVEGEVTRDPTYGLPALWIMPELREVATQARYTLVDAPTVLLTHLTEVLRRESASLLTRAETDRLLDRIRQRQPALIEELVPTILAVSDIQLVLQGLLREKVSIRHLDAILETLIDAGKQTKDIPSLIERVRKRLGAAICQGLAGGGKTLQVMTLDTLIESQLLQGKKDAQGNHQIMTDPVFMEQLLMRLIQYSEKMMKTNLLPVLLCTPELRRHLRAVTERSLPHLRIISLQEVPSTIELQSFAVVAPPSSPVADGKFEKSMQTS